MSVKGPGRVSNFSNKIFFIDEAGYTRDRIFNFDNVQPGQAKVNNQLLKLDFALNIWVDLVEKIIGPVVLPHQLTGFVHLQLFRDMLLSYHFIHFGSISRHRPLKCFSSCLYPSNRIAQFLRDFPSNALLVVLLSFSYVVGPFYYTVPVLEDFFFFCEWEEFL